MDLKLTLITYRQWTSLKRLKILLFCWSLNPKSRLRSASSSLLIIRCTRLSTADDRAFQCLEQSTTPRHVCTASSNFPAVVWRLVFSVVPFPTSRSACEVTLVIIGHLCLFCYLLTYIITLCVNVADTNSFLFRCCRKWRLARTTVRR